MRKLLIDEKNVYHMREYAIVENDDGTYEYVGWDLKGKKLSWIRGKAKVFGNVLAFTKITSEGEEEELETMKEVRKELKKLPDWWGKTKYYCIVLDHYATMLQSCVAGKPLHQEEEEYKTVRAMLQQHGIVLQLKAQSESATRSPGPFQP